MWFPVPRWRPHYFRLPTVQKGEKVSIRAPVVLGGLDKPSWRKDEGDDSDWDTVEAWFDFLYKELA